jgi:hypothetical protein
MFENVGLKVQIMLLLNGSDDGVQNTTFRKLNLFPSSGEERGDTYSVGSLRKT